MALKTKKPKQKSEKKPSQDETRQEPNPGGTTLLLIDTQNCQRDIEGADDDAKRIGTMIYEHAHKIDRIMATMDMRYKLHISHPGWWINDDGFHPQPNTRITSTDVESGKYTPNPKLTLSISDVMFDNKYLKKNDMLDDEDEQVNLYNYAIKYLQRLEQSERFNHTIWAGHCLVGTQGSNMHPLVMQALLAWTEETGRSVEWLNKGHDQLTEQMSILRADVVLSKETDYNFEFLSSLLLSERLLVAGQAKSHAVNWSLRDILEWWPDEDRSRIVLLQDATSPIKGYEQEAEQLEVFLREKEVQIVKVADAFP